MALMIFSNRSKTKFLHALGVPGALQERPAVLFCAWGGPLGAANACSLAKIEGNTTGFLMMLLFVSSGLGGIPGGVQISCLGQRRFQGAIPES